MRISPVAVRFREDGLRCSRYCTPHFRALCPGLSRSQAHVRNLLDKDLRDESTEGLVGNTWGYEDHPSMRAPLAHLLAQKRFEVPISWRS
jgi:hypothetical protein